jgi:hypothetical protein
MTTKPTMYTMLFMPNLRKHGLAKPIRREFVPCSGTLRVHVAECGIYSDNSMGAVRAAPREIGHVLGAGHVDLV